MYISSLMDSKPDFRRGDPGSFTGRGGYVFALQFFDVSNEETIGRQQKEEVLRWNVGKRRLRGRGLWKFRETLHVWWSYENC